MKKLFVLASALLAMLMLAGCATGCAHGFLHDPPTTGQSGSQKEDSSSAPASSAPAQYGSSADYRAVIEASRDDELNASPIYSIVTSPDDDMYDQIFSETMGFNAEDYERYAVSASNIITIAYGTAIILPKEGRADAVMQQVQGFVDTQKRAMENYLQDQYEITEGAIIKTAPTGEILLAMCKDAAAVMEAMEAGLAA